MREICWIPNHKHLSVRDCTPFKRRQGMDLTSRDATISQRRQDLLAVGHNLPDIPLNDQTISKKTLNELTGDDRSGDEVRHEHGDFAVTALRDAASKRKQWKVLELEDDQERGEVEKARRFEEIEDEDLDEVVAADVPKKKKRKTTGMSQAGNTARSGKVKEVGRLSTTGKASKASRARAGKGKKAAVRASSETEESDVPSLSETEESESQYFSDVKMVSETSDEELTRTFEKPTTGRKKESQASSKTKTDNASKTVRAVKLVKPVKPVHFNVHHDICITL